MFWGGESSVILDVDVFRVPSAWNLEINGRNYVKLQRQRFFSEQRLHMDRNDDVVVCTGAERIGHTPEHDGAIAEEHVVSNLHLFDNLKIRKKFTSVRLSSASVAYFLVVGWDCAVHFLRSAGHHTSCTNQDQTIQGNNFSNYWEIIEATFTAI